MFNEIHLIEIIDIGSVLVAVSLIDSIVKLRLINSIGAVVFQHTGL